MDMKKINELRENSEMLDHIESYVADQDFDNVIELAKLGYLMELASMSPVELEQETGISLEKD